MYTLLLFLALFIVTYMYIQKKIYTIYVTEHNQLRGIVVSLSSLMTYVHVSSKFENVVEQLRTNYLFDLATPSGAPPCDRKWFLKVLTLLFVNIPCHQVNIPFKAYLLVDFIVLITLT